jgi:hypothetical protein
MVRIFTTSFSFNHETYDAIVTLVARESRVSITVKVMDVALHDILPGGVVNYESSASLSELQNADNSLTQALMKSISVAVERHLVS